MCYKLKAFFVIHVFILCLSCVNQTTRLFMCNQNENWLKKGFVNGERQIK